MRHPRFLTVKTRGASDRRLMSSVELLPCVKMHLVYKDVEGNSLYSCVMPVLDVRLS
jgi:hypothetical protein